MIQCDSTFQRYSYPRLWAQRAAGRSYPCRFVLHFISASWFFFFVGWIWLIFYFCDFIPEKAQKKGKWGGWGVEKKNFLTLSSGFIISLAISVGTTAGLDSVIAEVVVAATLMARVVGKGNIDILVTLNTDESTLYRGAHIKGVGITVPVKHGLALLLPMETENFNVRENSSFFTVGEVVDFSVVEAAVRDASKGMVEVSFIFRKSR